MDARASPPPTEKGRQALAVRIALEDFVFDSNR
jgi:hypothetical protein